MINRRLVGAFLSSLLLLACSFYVNNDVQGEVGMRVEFTTEGGLAYFPGLSKPVIIDSNQLSVADVAELKQSLEAVQFFALPEEIGQPAPGAADYRRYTITVEEEGNHHTVTLIEPIFEPNIQRLLSFLKAQAKLRR
jgi:hypothetical protein